MDLNEYIIIQDVNIAIILQFFYLFVFYPLDLLLSEESTRRGRDRGRVTDGGEVQTLLFRIKSVVYFSK